MPVESIRLCAAFVSRGDVLSMCGVRDGLRGRTGLTVRLACQRCCLEVGSLGFAVKLCLFEDSLLVL